MAPMPGSRLLNAWLNLHTRSSDSGAFRYYSPGSPLRGTVRSREHPSAAPDLVIHVMG